jgi:F0F1-type ATP synthase membrane subunit c/vacuolar-type H+-ATPase subunit K
MQVISTPQIRLRFIAILELLKAALHHFGSSLKEWTMRHLFLPATLAVGLALAGCSGSSGIAALPQQNVAANSPEQASSFMTATSVGSARTDGSMRSGLRTLGRALGRRSIVPITAASKSIHLCATPSNPGHASCFATVRADSLIRAAFPDDVNGLTPNDLSTLYKYPAPAAQGSAGKGQTVEVVVVGDYAAAESDLAVYRSHFGLPPCTTANGCLTKISTSTTGQISVLSGGSSSISAYAASISAYAATPSSTGWAGEVDTDTQMISATCPQCKIVISEAATDSISDLSQAVITGINTAGVTIVSASFGTPESISDLVMNTAADNYQGTKVVAAYDNYRGVKVVAAAGDYGYGVYFPASQNSVIAVGGTTLSASGSTVNESVWSGTGSGCSMFFPRESWQKVPTTGCSMRSVVDIAAVADPNTGVAIYDSTLAGTSGGWATFGGTSVSAPIITGIISLSGDTQGSVGAQKLYAAASSNFLKITSGSNGTCAALFLCTAQGGYSGPTGLGIPQGLGGF